MTRKAVISGATKGMGRAIAIELAKEGFDLALASRNEKELTQFKMELKKINPSSEIVYQGVDLSIKNEIKAYGDWVKTLWPKIDVLVNNVGSFVSSKIINEDEDILEKMMNINFYSAYYLTRSFLSGMITAKSGHIFTICSIASLTPVLGAGAYSISKHALLGLTRSLREEVREYNIKVTTLLPGSTYTSSWEGTKVSKDKLIQPEDIARAVINAYKMSNSAVAEEIIIKPLTKNS